MVQAVSSRAVFDDSRQTKIIIIFEMIIIETMFATQKIVSFHRINATTILIGNLKLH